MSINFQRDSNKKIIKRNVQFTSTPSLTNNNFALQNPNNVNLSSLTLNGTPISASGTRLNYLNVTPGTASSNKALVTNSSNNISNIGAISCNSLTVNGENITGIVLNTGGGESNSPYLTNIVDGKAEANKAMIFDSNNNISNVNTLNTKALTLKNNTILATGTTYTRDYNAIYAVTYNSVNTAGSMLSICYSPELNLYVSVGSVSPNFIMTSTNGTNWIQQTCPTSANSWNSICWSSALNLFVVVSSNCTTSDGVMTSSNGINWTTRTVPTANNWSSVTCRGSLFVAVSSNGTTSDNIMTSTDGINWTSRTSPTANAWSSVTGNNTIFVAFSANGASSNNIMTSSDGITWTSRSSPNTNNWRSVCWSDDLNLFIAVSYFSSGGQSGQVTTSPNGTSWTSCISASNKDWISVIWSTKYQLAIAVSNDGCIMFSSNGTNWFFRNTTTSNLIRCICWGSRLNNLVVCGSDSTSSNPRFGVLNKIIENNIYKSNILTSIFNNLQSFSLFSIGSSFHYTSVCWSPQLKLFVGIIGSSTVNQVITSLDGITWIARASAANNSWSSICWSPELNLFVAVSTTGTSNRVMTSSNGINWTSRTSAAANQWNSVCWSPSLSLFVAVASSGTTSNNIMTSSDGITWTSRTSPNTNQWISVCWSPELSLFAAVSISGTNNRVMTSSNGINWTSRTSATNNTWNSICWSPQLGMFSAISNDGSASMISYDGITWMVSSTFVASYNLKSCCWCDKLGVFITIGTSGSILTLLYSYNGINWLTASVPSKLTVANALCWSPELSIFVILPSSGNIGFKSFNINDLLSINMQNFSSISNNNLSNYKNNNLLLKNWYTKTSTVNNIWKSVVFSEELCLIVAISSDGTTSDNIMSSTDGNNWISRTSPNTNEWNGICWSPELSLFVAVSSTGFGDRVMTSSDGITWTSRTSAADNQWKSVCWSPELSLFVAVSSTGLSRVMVSSDGINWTSYSAVTNNEWKSICWSPELSLFVAVASSGTNNRIMTSTNGTSWTSRTSVADNSWSSVCWSAYLNLFVAVSSDGSRHNQIMISPNGINWVNKTSPVLNSWTSICWSFDLKIFIAVSSSGTNDRIMSSIDGMNWFIQTSASNNDWESVTWCNSLSIFVAVASSGSNDRIMISNISLPTYKTTLSPNNPFQLYTLKPGVTNSYGTVYQINSGAYTISSFLSKFSIMTTSAYNFGCMRLVNNSSATNYVDFDLNSTATQLNVTVNGTNKIFNIVNHNGSTTGLQLGGTNFDIQGLDFSLLNSTPGTASASKVLITDSSNNISGINNLSVNSLFINNKLYLTSSANNSNYLTNINPGTAVASTVLVTNSDNNVGNINTLSVTSANVNKTDVINTKISSSNLDKVFSSFKLYDKYPSNIVPNSIAYSPSLGIIVAVGYSWSTDEASSIYNIMYSYNGIDWYAANSNIQIGLRSICWSDQLSMFVAVGNQSIITKFSSRIIYSYDGINWMNAIVPLNSGNELSKIESVCYSPSLNLFAACTSETWFPDGILTSPDGIVWTKRTTANSNVFTSICWADSLSLFIVVSSSITGGTSGQVMTSPNGTTWTNQSSATSAAWYSVCWSPTLSLLVAVGNNAVMTSSNGTTWTSATPASSNIVWSSVCWSSYANAFIAVGNSGTGNRMMKSSNGTNWSSIDTSSINTTYSFVISIDPLNFLLTTTNNTSTAPYSTNRIAICTNSDASSWTFNPTTYDLGFNRIVYADTLNLLVTAGYVGQKNILTSTNGKNWTLQTPASLNSYYNDIVWASSLSLLLCIGNGIIHRSSNGINWSSVSSVPSGQWKSICWSPQLSLFISVATNSNSSNFMRSSDGINWTAFTVTGSNWHSVCWSPALSLFVAVNFAGSVASSSDGINWTTTSIISGIIYVQWISQMNLFITQHSTGYYISYDGINWTSYSRLTFNGNTGSFNRYFDYFSQYNVLVGGCTFSSDYKIVYSYDAITWYLVNYPIFPNSLTNFISVPELNISIFYSSITNKPFAPFLTFDYNEYINKYDRNYNLSNLDKNLLPNSTLVTNAISTYYTRTSAADNNWNSICWSYALNLFVAVSSSGTSNRVMTSPNGIIWTSRTSAADNNWTSICWSSELSLLVAVASSGTNNRIMSSPNSITWTTRETTDFNNNWTSVCWSPELLIFVAVASTGTNNRVITSSNGIDWSLSVTTNLNNNWTSVCWAKYIGLFVAVAESGTGNRVMTSPDGITWTGRSSTADINWKSICYNSYSNLLVAVSSTISSGINVMTSSNGINWTGRTTNLNQSWNSVCWSPELNVFIAVASSGTDNRVMTSFDGISWTSRTSSENNQWNSVCWSPELSIFAAVSSTGTNNRVMTSLSTLPNLLSTIQSDNNTINVNQNNGRVGLSVAAPLFQLHLSLDTATKPSTSTWTVSSDERLKENIQDANLDTCYNNIKNIKLKKYTWKDEVYTIEQVSDRSKLGWVAQEVETVFPKAVEKHNMHGYEDCRTLNSDQIIASMYGCLQKLINIYDNQTNELNLLDTNLSKLQNTVEEITK